jgi:hypothetical protein
MIYHRTQSLIKVCFAIHTRAALIQRHFLKKLLE